VPAFKLFLGASTGNMLVSDTTALEAIFSLRKIPIACHCEDEKIIKANIAAYREKYGEAIDPSFHPLIRSREAAIASSTAAVSFARRGGARLHLLHLSTAEETTLLTPGEDPSLKQIIGEACVHHLWFDDTSYATKGNLIKWNPPVRSSADRDALLSAVRKGLIDIIATDHAPHTTEEKSAPYFSAPSGGPTVQHSLVMMLELCHRGELTPELVVRKMCHNPAKLFAIEDRGFVREGYKADLVLVDPAAPWTVSSENILYKCGWSPLEGTTFRSSVIITFVNGIPVFENGGLTGLRAPEMLRFNR
jgi:dihydroorotase